MGFFGGSKTYVASSIYNLAGDEENRASYLKTAVIGAVLSPGSNTSIAGVLQSAYLNSPGIKLRSFFRWAEDHYGQIGVPVGNLGSTIRVDARTVEGQIPGQAGKTVKVQQVEGGIYDYSYFAEQWMFANRPTQVGTAWSADVNGVTHEITITFADNTKVTFIPSANRDARFIYAIYNLVDNATQNWGNAQLFIYQIGSGNAVLDALVTSTDDDGEYAPHIPVRLNNKFLSAQYKPAAYEAAKAAYKKAIGGKLDDLIAKIEDNESLPDIDFAYVVFGVPMNVRENASREYLYRFFDKCRLSQTTSAPRYASSETAKGNFFTQVAAWQLWKLAQNNPASPLYGKPQPWLPSQPADTGSSVHIKSSGATDTNLNMKISWGSIVRTTGTGLKKPGAKKGEVWLTIGGAGVTAPTGIITNGTKVETTSGEKIAPMTISWQTEENHWQSLTIFNLVHKNLIYNDKSVIISASEALEDLEDSGFIVPLHMETVREMGLVSSTQMMTAATYIVFNSYEVVKTKWYETGFFKLVLFVVVIAIAVATGGVGAGLVPGVLGTAAGVGAALGLTGLAAIIAGTVVNAIAAMVISQLIMAGSVMLLGDKWGQIVGAIVAVIALDVGTALSSGATMGAVFNSMTSASSLIRLSQTTSQGIQGFLSAEAAEINKATQETVEKHKRDLQDLQDRFAAEFGYGRAYLNPMGSTDTPFGNFIEGEQQFLDRTLLTGMDIAELSHDMITNYTSYMLRTDLRL